MNLARIISVEIQQVKTIKGALKLSVAIVLFKTTQEILGLYKIIRLKKEIINRDAKVECQAMEEADKISRSEVKERNKSFSIYEYLLMR